MNRSRLTFICYILALLMHDCIHIQVVISSRIFILTLPYLCIDRYSVRQLCGKQLCGNAFSPSIKLFIVFALI